MFQLKNKETLFGINKEESTHDTPVFEKNLEGGVQAEANRDGTIFVQKGLSKNEISEAVKHEKVHIDQMKCGDLDYDDTNVYWKGKKYSRAQMKEGAKNLPWEAEAYKKAK